MLNAVLVLMVATSILGPVLTERFAPRMLEDDARKRDAGGAGSVKGPAPFVVSASRSQKCPVVETTHRRGCDCGM